MVDINKDITSRIKNIRLNPGNSMQEMEDATYKNAADYFALENDEKDFNFTFLHKCATKFDVDFIQLVNGSSPCRIDNQISSTGKNLSDKCCDEFDYLYWPMNIKGRLADSFFTAFFVEKKQAQDKVIHFNYRRGLELDYINSTKLSFSFERNEEIPNLCDTVLYDNDKNHRMIAIIDKTCGFFGCDCYA